MNNTWEQGADIKTNELLKTYFVNGSIVLSDLFEKVWLVLTQQETKFSLQKKLYKAVVAM